MPQFAWELVSDKKNVKQKSYELQIAKDADFTDLIYNSGKTESEESAHVYAEDASLESGKRYFVLLQKPVMVRKKRTGAKPHLL